MEIRDIFWQDSSYVWSQQAHLWLEKNQVVWLHVRVSKPGVVHDYLLRLGLHNICCGKFLGYHLSLYRKVFFLVADFCRKFCTLEHGRGYRRSWNCCDRRTCFVVIWKHFCFILSTGTKLRIDSVMHPRSSSRGHNTSASVTVTLPPCLWLTSDHVV